MHRMDFTSLRIVKSSFNDTQIPNQANPHGIHVHWANQVILIQLSQKNVPYFFGVYRVRVFKLTLLNEQ